MINNSLFKADKIPNFHPIVDVYESDEWWRVQKRRCIEGYWVSGKWMPPELYYYINFHHIILQEGIYKGLSLPWLRDIDWEKAFIFAEATGFSGFDGDDVYSCNRMLIDDVKDEDIFAFCSEKDTGEIRKDYLSNFFNKKGERKIYVPAREYLRKIHPTNMGKALYLNEAKHLLELASRGYGKSYSTSGLIAHNFLFDGARDYDLYLKLRHEKTPLQSETVVGAIDTKYSNKLMSKVKVGLEKLPGSSYLSIDGEQVFYASPLSIAWTGSFAVGKEAFATVSKSLVQHVTFADNPLAAAGGRPNRVFIDEVGFMNNIKEAWEGVENTQASEDFKRLTMYGMGTGGLTSGGAVTYLQELFYDPETFGCLVFEDEWENKGDIGYFVPGTLAMNKFKEGPNLITNMEKATKNITDAREKAKKTKKSTRIQGTIINKPLVPSEIFLRMEGTMFPTHELKEALGALESNPIRMKSAIHADLVEKTKGNVQLLPTEKTPIYNYPLLKNDEMDACVQIFQKPKYDADGFIQAGRYIMATDPVDDDGNDNTARSLQSTFVLDLWTDSIVAEYTARTYLASEYYENVRKLCMYYNAINLYENNKKGMYGHFKNKSSLMYLAETPQILKEEDLVKSKGIGNRSLGVNMSSDKVKLYGINEILEWLEKPSYHNPEIKILYTIPSVGLYKELISFSMDVNADRVSALLALMIYRAEVQFKIDTLKNKTVKSVSSSSIWGNAYGAFNKNKQERAMAKYLQDYDIN